MGITGYVKEIVIACIVSWWRAICQCLYTAILFPGIYPLAILTHLQNDIYTKIFLLVIDNSKKFRKTYIHRIYPRQLLNILACYVLIEKSPEYIVRLKKKIKCRTVYIPC